MIPCHPVTRRKFDRSRRELGVVSYRSIPQHFRNFFVRKSWKYHSFVLASGITHDDTMYHYVAFEFAIVLGSWP